MFFLLFSETFFNFFLLGAYYNQLIKNWFQWLNLPPKLSTNLQGIWAIKISFFRVANNYDQVNKFPVQSLILFHCWLPIKTTNLLGFISKPNWPRFGIETIIIMLMISMLIWVNFGESFNIFKFLIFLFQKIWKKNFSKITSK